MKKLLLIFFISILLVGCEKQESNMILYQNNFNEGLNLLMGIKKNYSDTLSIGIENDKVPLLINWQTYQDSINTCAKLINVKISRTGGNSRIILSNFRSKVTGSCVFDWNGDTLAYDLASVFYDCKFKKWFGISGFEMINQSINIDGKGRLKH